MHLQNIPYTHLHYITRILFTHAYMHLPILFTCAHMCTHNISQYCTHPPTQLHTALPGGTTEQRCTLNSAAHTVTPAQKHSFLNIFEYFSIILPEQLHSLDQFGSSFGPVLDQFSLNDFSYLQNWSNWSIPKGGDRAGAQVVRARHPRARVGGFWRGPVFQTALSV